MGFRGLGLFGAYGFLTSAVDRAFEVAKEKKHKLFFMVVWASIARLVTVRASVRVAEGLYDKVPLRVPARV